MRSLGRKLVVDGGQGFGKRRFFMHNRFLKAFGRWLLLLVGVALIYSFLVQPWHMRWGASDAESAMPLAGDSYIPSTTVVSTRAITIHAPVAEVWPWLIQIGQERAGFYSYEWLENLFAARMHNADRIVPAWQHPQVGQQVGYMANPPLMSVTEIARIDPEQMMVLKGGWGFYLQPIDAQTTRLIVRYASFPIQGSLSAALFYYALFEPIHFVMESGMMLGIKQRAERVALGHGRMPSAGLATAIKAATQ
jgi:hypothetical protein